MWKLMFKGIGALLILYAGGALGWHKGDACARRVRVLSEMCAFLDAVRRELHFRCGRTEEILAEAQKNTRLAALPLYFLELDAGSGLQTELDSALQRTEREIEEVTLPFERAALRGALEGLGACPAREELFLPPLAAVVGLIIAIVKYKKCPKENSDERKGYKFAAVILGIVIVIMVLAVVSLTLLTASIIANM